MDHAVVQKWLRSVLKPYGNEDRVFADVDRTLIAISSLAPKTEVYTYDDGRTQLLLVLTGTIPVQYRGSTYNIPMEIWVPRAYPREPPIAYVTPTSDMLVRKGTHVDVSGRVGGNYLANWARKWEACNLLDLVHDFQSIFGQEPPVYAKPKASNTAMPASPIASSSRSSQPPQSPSYARQPPSDPRLRGPLPPPSPGSASRGPDGTPLRPPKPGQMPDDARRTSSGSQYAGTWSPGQNGHPRSALPPQAGGSRQWSDHGYVAEPQNIASPSQQAPDHQAQRRHTSWTPGAGGSGHVDWHANPQHRQASGSAVPPPLPPPAPRPGSQYGYEAYGVRQGPDLHTPLQSPHAPAPPRPLNPELMNMHDALHRKIHARLQYLRATTEEGNGQLRLLCEDLDRGDAAIKDEMARLEAVRDVCRTTGDELEGAVLAAQQRTIDLQAREEPDVDGLICATSLVGNQLIDLVAEDNAIEDTLYHLGRALHAEVIDLDRFLKQTRYLAREQFMRRALAQKISSGMGW